MKIEKRQCYSITTAVNMATLLGENIPDVKTIFVEPTEAIGVDQLPNISIFLAEEEVQDEREQDVSEMLNLNPEGGLAEDGHRACCGDLKYVRQYYLVTVSHESCEDAYLNVGYISCMMEQIMEQSQIPNLSYDGNRPARSDDFYSSDNYIKTYTYYVEYWKHQQ